MTKSELFKIYYIALSNYIKTELTNHGYPKNKIKVIYNISELKPKGKTTVGRKNQMVFAGRIESEKGIWVVIKALELINNPLFHLLFIGEGSMLTELKEYVKNRNIKNVDFLGKITNKKVIENYKRSKIIIAPSIWPEPFGRFIQESIASNTPIITTRVGGIPEGIKNKENGILINPNNSKQLAEAVKELLQNKKLYNKIVKSLKEESDRYSPKKILTERLKIYTRFA